MRFLRKFAVISSALIFASAVVFISILRTASVRYSFNPIYANYTDKNIATKSQEIQDIKIDYQLAYPGPVLPDSYFWLLKAARDKVWLIVTTNEAKKAELYLLFADKRLAAAKILFEKGKYELGFGTLTKAEKYLEQACNLEEKVRSQGQDTSEFTLKLINASLKHRQIIKQIILVAPEELKPKITIIEDYPRGVYGRKVHILQGGGVEVPIDPFNGL